MSHTIKDPPFFWQARAGLEVLQHNTDSADAKVEFSDLQRELAQLAQKPSIVDFCHPDTKHVPARESPRRAPACVMAGTGLGPICIDVTSPDKALAEMVKKLDLKTAAIQGGHFPQAHGLQWVYDRPWTSSTCSGASTCEAMTESLQSQPGDVVIPREMVRRQSKREQTGMTTLMVRNVPTMYTQQLLIKEWANEDGAYDFLYLPCGSAGQANLSFAFINFVSEAHAVAFKARWHKARMARYSARKPLNIGFADVQGLRANIVQVTRRRTSGCGGVPRSQLPHIVMNGTPVAPEQALAMLEG